MKQALGAIIFALVCAISLHGVAHAGASVGVVFSDDEVRIIASWYRDHQTSSQPEAQGKKPKGLPPGIARNLERGKALPPGIAKRSLPNDLVHLLPPPPRGYERVIVDGRVLLVEVATRVIHDILADVVLR